MHNKSSHKDLSEPQTSNTWTAHSPCTWRFLHAQQECAFSIQSSKHWSDWPNSFLFCQSVWKQSHVYKL